MKETANFDAALAARKLMRQARSAALATLMPGSCDPYCSLVNVATAVDGSPLLLISRLAVHTRNILHDSRCSLMIDERKAGDPLEGARITLQTRAQEAADDTDRRRYLARQPGAEMFAGFGDFSFYKLEVASAHLVAGFGRIVDLDRDRIATRLDDAQALVASEAEIVQHMNEEHLDTCRLYATRLLGDSDGDWRCVGCDPEGIELQLYRTARWLQFPERVATPSQLREALRQLADAARCS